MKKRNRRNKEYNENQKSFYFEDYFETNLRNKKVKNSTISQDRVYLLFFLFFSLVTIFSIKIILVSLKSVESYFQKNNTIYQKTLRRDIIDRNGVVVSRNINSFHAAINPRMIKNK